MRNTLLLMIIGSLALQNVAWAKGVSEPSFDCNKATTAVEKNICSSATLADLDKKVSDAFFALKKNPNGRIKVSMAELLKDQREWLKYRDRDNCLDDCLVQKYQDRLAELSFPGAPKDLDDAKIKTLDTYFANKNCASFKPIMSSVIMETDGICTWAQKVFANNLSRGEALFYQCDDNRDVVSCDYSAELKKIDGLQEFIDDLLFLYGSASQGDCGNLGQYEVASRDLAVLRTLYDKGGTNAAPSSSTENFNSFGSDPAAALKQFSLKGVWEKIQYAKFLGLKEKAQQGLEKYYITSKKMSADEAKRLAEAHIQDLTNVYVSSHYSRYDDWTLDKVDAFLKSGALPDNKDSALPTLLKFAVVNDYPKDAIEKIIDAGANKQDPKMSDALMNSVKKPEIMKLLIDKGANVNAQNTFGKTALMYAIQYGNLDAVKILVDHKADVNLATFDKDKITDTCTYWLNAGKRTPLMYAAWHANDEVVQYLLAKGADPNAKDSNDHDYKFYLSQNDYQKNS